MKIGNLDVNKVMLGSDEVTAIYAGTELVYPSTNADKYLTFRVSTDATKFTFSGNSVYYSIDNGPWTFLSANTQTPNISIGSTIRWKATLTPNHSSQLGIGRFYANTNTKRFTVEGNPMSLLFGDNFRRQTSLSGIDYAFKELFYNATGLTSIDDISLCATELSNYCYYAMFKGCTNLTSVPLDLLPASAMTNSCYFHMFNGCSSLTNTPTLSSTTLADYCYDGMFSSGTSLTAVTELPATTLAQHCYQFMFNNCSSLTDAPMLPAATLVRECYSNMFYGCSSLSAITCLATYINARDATTQWTMYVAQNGVFTKAPSISSWTTGNNGIPSNWTVQDYT